MQGKPSGSARAFPCDPCWIWWGAGFPVVVPRVRRRVSSTGFQFINMDGQRATFVRSLNDIRDGARLRYDPKWSLILGSPFLISASNFLRDQAPD